MDNVRNVRHVCVIGHQNHGKSTLTSTLYSIAGITPPSTPIKLDYRYDDGGLERHPLTIIKPTIFSLYCEMAKEDLDNTIQESHGKSNCSQREKDIRISNKQILSHSTFLLNRLALLSRKWLPDQSG